MAEGLCAGAREGAVVPPLFRRRLGLELLGGGGGAGQSGELAAD